MAKKTDQREKRRRKRKQSQVAAFAMLFLFVGCIGFGGYKGIQVLIEKQKAKNAAEQQALVDLNVSDSVSENNVPESVLPDLEEVSENIVPEPEEEVVDSPEVQAAKEKVAAMSLEEKISGLFILHPESITGVDNVVLAGDGTKDALSLNRIGGLYYRSSNVTGKDAFQDMTTKTKDMNEELYGEKLLLFVWEDGSVSTIAGSSTGEAVIDTAKTIGDSGDSGNAYSGYLNISTMLKNYSIDGNFGIVASVGSDDNYLGDRCFSDDADLTASMVKSAVSAENDQKILSCLVAFPGEGAATSDPANGSVSVSKTLEELKETEYVPFVSGIDAGAKMVMVSSITYSNAFGDKPACFSVEAIESLRNDLGFEGVIVSDDLSKKAITDHYTSGEATVNALLAGCDMILCPADFSESYQAIVAAIGEGTITEEQIDAALVRIYVMRDTLDE